MNVVMGLKQQWHQHIESQHRDNLNGGQLTLANILYCYRECKKLVKSNLKLRVLHVRTPGPCAFVKLRVRVMHSLHPE